MLRYHAMYADNVTDFVCFHDAHYKQSSIPPVSFIVDLNINTKSEKKLSGTLPKTRVAAEAVTQKLLPPKSLYKYTFVYNMFITWRQTNEITSVSENVLLAYFDELSNTLATSTLNSVGTLLNVEKHVECKSKNQH